MNITKHIIVFLALLGISVGSSAYGQSTRPCIELVKAQSASSSGGIGCLRDMHDVAICGVVYSGRLGADIDEVIWPTWKVPNGYTVLEGFFGVQDGRTPKKTATLRVLVDGDIVKTFQASPMQKATRVSVSLNGGRSLRLEYEGAGAILDEPKLLSGPTPGPPNPMVTSSAYSGSTSSGNSPANFAVDPKDLDSLAANLRKRVDNDADLRRRVNEGQIALMTFTLVDISSAAVATNVVEDLSTAMINSGFKLVERGQLDKVLRELKVQQSGLMDPQTIQKVGVQTGCDLILLGSISDRGQFAAINSRLVETATGKALAAERVEMRKIPISR